MSQRSQVHGLCAWRARPHPIVRVGGIGQVGTYTADAYGVSTYMAELNAVCLTGLRISVLRLN